MNKEQITALARKHGTSYTNRHFVGEPAFAFGNEAWANFVDALVTVQPVQVAELMRLVETYGVECSVDGANGGTSKDTLQAFAAVEAFARAAMERPAVPDGWQLVPIEPTRQMYLAGGGSIAARCYRDMLAAAPTETPAQPVEV